MADSSDWFHKSINSLALNGKAERTQESYTRALRMLCEFYANKPPEAITEAELEAYFLHRKNVDGWSANTLRIGYCGIRFYFVKVLGRDWQLFNYLRARSESRLPAILCQDEVHGTQLRLTSQKHFPLPEHEKAQRHAGLLEQRFETTPRVVSNLMGSASILPPQGGDV